MSNKIAGVSLLGFSDFFEEPIFFQDVLGANPLTSRPASNKNAKQATGRPTKNLKIPVRHAKPSGKPSPHKTAIVNTINAGKRAIAAGKGAALDVKNHSANVRGGRLGPIVKVQPTRVNGDGTVVLGATVSRVLSPMQKAAVGKHVNAVARLAAENRRLEKLAAKAQVVGTGALATAKTSAIAIKRAFSPKWKTGPTRIRGTYTSLGLSQPDPDNPGFNLDGSLNAAMTDPSMADPNASATDPNAAMDDGTGAVYAPDGTTCLYDPATDPMVVPMPVRGGVLSPDEAQQRWSKVPDDAIAYDGSFGLPANSVGSWSCFYSAQKNSDGWGIPSFLRGSLDGGVTIQWLYNSPENKDQGFHLAGPEFQSTATSGAPECKGVSANSMQRGWGPIVGNPRDTRLASLQYASDEGVWFWQGKNCPVWASQEADSKIATANQKTIAANRMTALVQAAQMNKDLIAMQEGQAKQDAVNALAMSAADTQSQIMQMQMDSQQGQLDVQSQKADLDLQTQQNLFDLQTQQAALEDAKRQAALDAEAQHALIDQTNVWNTWAQAHPEEAVAQMQQQVDDGGLDEGAAYDFSDGAYGGSLDDFEGDDDTEDF